MESQHFHTRSNSHRRNRQYLAHLCNIYSIFRTVVFQYFAGRVGSVFSYLHNAFTTFFLVFSSSQESVLLFILESGQQLTGIHLKERKSISFSAKHSRKSNPSRSLSNINIFFLLFSIFQMQSKQA